MKILNRIIILVLCVYLAICQINRNIYSYTEEEIKSIIQYKTVEDDGEPEKYDLEIDAKNLKSDAKIPVIQASFDYVLYGNGFFSNINFLGLKDNRTTSSLKYTNSGEISKNSKRWINLSNISKNFLRVSLYIATASLLTLLIYFAIVIVKGSISDNGIQLPGENITNIYGKSIDKKQRDKMVIEEWIKSVGMMAIIIVIINIVVSFSNMISNMVIKDEISNPISVYIKSDASSTEGIPDLPDDLENLQAKDLFAWGDIANEQEGGEAAEYIINTIGSLANIAHSRYPMKRSIVIAQVINETGWVKTPAEGGQHSNPELVRDWNNILGFNNYEAISSPETTWAKKGSKNDWCWMPQNDGPHWENVKVFENIYDCIEDWMGQFIYHHPNIDDYENYENYRSFLTGYTSAGWANHCQDIIKKYNLERFDNMPDTPVGTKGSLKACYFNTNLEGVYMLESQYDWEDNFLHNLMYIVCGFCLTCFKWFCFLIFLVRVVLVAFLIAIAPVIIIINAVQKVNGGKGLLIKWFILYVYAVLLKPALGIIYFIMTKLNTRFVAENPFFILLVIVVMFISYKISISKVIGFVTNRKK